MASTEAPPPVGIDRYAVPMRPAAEGGPKRRTVRLGGRDYLVLPPSLRDPRLHVAGVLLTIQVLGQAVLGWRLSIAQILACLAAGALIEFVVAFFKDHSLLWPASGLLTGNSTALLLRVPGTLHGQWWSTHGIEIFVGVVAFGMASKYLIRWRGRHLFNPSNVALVAAFIVLGPRLAEPLDLWWIPIGPWLIATYAILVVGGLLVAWELKLLGLVIGFMAAFAASLVLALAWVPDHCMVASWHVTPLCGRDLLLTLVTSPEILIFALFMIPDPRTVPESPAARIIFGVLVGVLAVLLLGPTTLEFWTKTAILSSLAVACALRFALSAFLAPFEAGPRRGTGSRRLWWRVPVALGMVFGSMGALPAAAQLSTHSPDPAAGLSDGSLPAVTLTVGPRLGIAEWVTSSAGAALPPAAAGHPAAASALVWTLPPLPAVSIDSNVTSFDPSITPQTAAQMARDVVLDLVIESEARRSHNLVLAASGATGDGLKEFVDVIKQDGAAGKIVQKTYRFDQVSLRLYLPKFASQAARLVGVSLRGTATVTSRDASGRVLSQTSSPYAKSWGLTASTAGANQVIVNDYSDLAPAP